MSALWAFVFEALAPVTAANRRAAQNAAPRFATESDDDLAEISNSVGTRAAPAALEAARPHNNESHAEVVCLRPSLRQLAASDAASRCAGAGSTDAAGSASAGCSSGRACAGLGQQRGV